MEYPTYSAFDAGRAIKDGDNNVAEFEDFLGMLKEGGYLEDEKEEGIIALVRDRGTEVLSSKQSYVLKQIVDRYPDTCERCASTIPFHERIDAADNGGFCNYCAHMMSKDD